ncbi:FAD-dependent oxidoreductase [Dorea sp. YH-dor226]|uniref:FAD-dependent oxidoreductase n=1 Tax=Dorea sp. YH-dor226 TaxID=3151119 RepID=UPI003241DB59
MDTLWNRITDFNKYESLTEDVCVDTIVIGAGIAGLMTAYFLRDKGVQVAVLEADRIVSGQTAGTTAKITSQHNMIYQRLIRCYGIERARMYAGWNEWAIYAYEKIIEDKKIECNFTRCSAYLYSCRKDMGLDLEVESAKKLGIDAEYKTTCELPFPVRQAAEFKNQARFDPLRFLKGILEGIKIYENSRVYKVERIREGETRLYTSGGTVTARNVVFACHFPFVNIPGYYFARMYQSRSYVLALKNAAQFEGYYLGVEEDGYSFRNEGEYLLFGGGKHRTGGNAQGGKYHLLQKKAKEWWPECEEIAHWSAQDCMTLDGIPYIGRFEKRAEDWYVLTGFGKWGMTSALAGARIISDMITGKTVVNQEIYSPQRRISNAMGKEFAKHSMITAGNLCRELLAVEKTVRWKTTEQEIELSLRCPHLGCRLAWNPDEATWECPCHGSGFDRFGNILNGPAQKELYNQRKAFLDVMLTFISNTENGRIQNANREYYQREEKRKRIYTGTGSRLSWGICPCSQ